MKIVIVGGSHAALAAAQELRKQSAQCEVIIVSADTEAPYQRPPLSKGYMSGKVGFEQILLRPEDWYQQNSVRLIRGVRVQRIDRELKRIELSDGTVLTYDALILATGASPRRLPSGIGGSLPNVHVMRDLVDADQLMERMKEGARLVVIGGGYIGLEAASEASKKGVMVTVIEAADRILKRVACAETADDVRSLHHVHGVRIFENASLVRILEADGQATGVELSDGSVIVADFLITGIGVVPNEELAVTAGLEVGNGIVVDANLRTSDPAIFAIGDCANFEFRNTRIRLESVQNANDMGVCAARNVLGHKDDYKPVPWFWSDQFDLKLQIAGLNSGYDRVITRAGQREGAKSHFYFRGEAFLAVDCMNDGATYMVARRLLEAGKTLSPEQVEDPALNLKTLLG